MVTKRPHPTHWARLVPKVIRAVVEVRGWPLRVVVAGPSMLPAFEPGDRLLVIPVRTVAPGQIVALVDPAGTGRLLVKRVARLDRAGVDVRGDNEGASTDSRTFGPIPMSALAGRAVYRYHPPGRAGRLAE